VKSEAKFPAEIFLTFFRFTFTILDSDLPDLYDFIQSGVVKIKNIK
jgi:hypothetical protein